MKHAMMLVPVRYLWVGARLHHAGTPFPIPAAERDDALAVVDALQSCSPRSIYVSCNGTRAPFAPGHVVKVAVAGAIHPCAEWGGEGPKPRADHWYWSKGNRWVAVVAEWEQEWWTDADPEDVAGRPGDWARPITDVPTSGTLAYCVNESDPREHPANPAAFTVDEIALATLIAQGKLEPVAHNSLTRGEDAAALVNAALDGHAIKVPDDLPAGVEGDDDEQGCWIRLSLQTPLGGPEVSTEWEHVDAEIYADVGRALACVVAELNGLVTVCDPREPNARDAIVYALATCSRGDETPGADLQMHLTSSYAITDDEVAAHPAHDPE
jgi:hypothetical protein